MHLKEKKSDTFYNFLKTFQVFKNRFLWIICSSILKIKKARLFLKSKRLTLKNMFILHCIFLFMNLTSKFSVTNELKLLRMVLCKDKVKWAPHNCRKGRRQKKHILSIWSFWIANTVRFIKPWNRKTTVNRSDNAHEAQQLWSVNSPHFA